jgi:hypothetical protein
MFNDALSQSRQIYRAISYDMRVKKGGDWFFFSAVTIPPD